MQLFKISKLMILLASMFIACAAKARDDYRCVIERVSVAQGDIGSSYEFYRRNYIGKEFTVERTSGLMAGAIKNSYVTKPEVIDFGSKENSYKVVTTLRRDQSTTGSNIYALTILEYLESEKKPFVFLENEAVFFGRCVHF